MSETFELEQIIRKASESMPFYQLTGMELARISEGEFVGELEIADKHRNAAGSVHGGMLYTMIDTFAGAHAAFVMQKGVVTVNSHIEFLRPAVAGRISCKTEIIRAGRNFTRVRGDIFDAEGNLLCTSMNTYYPVQ